MVVSSARRGGIAYVRVNGEQLLVKGSWTVRPGGEIREGIVGADGAHGYKVMHQVPRIEGAGTWDPSLDLDALNSVTDGTVVLQLENGRRGVLRNAYYAGELELTTEEAEFSVAFEGLDFQWD